ncbi:MAG TPA: hypothetical protein HPP56_05300 [Nitrospirae bacterium]|nr:hypothetical protein [Nitrospirota bacterium]
MLSKNHNRKITHLIKKNEDHKVYVNYRRQRTMMIVSSLFIAILLGIFVLAPKIKNDLINKKLTNPNINLISEKKNQNLTSQDK